VIAAHAAAAQNSAKQALVNSTAAASNSASTSSGSPFDAILAALGIGDDDGTSPAIPTAAPQTTANAGAPQPSGTSTLAARTQKTLASKTANSKALKSLKVLTPSQAALLATQMQGAIAAQQAQAQPAAQPTQTALNASLVSSAGAASGGSSITNAISSVESAIKGGISDVMDALGGGKSSTTPVSPPLAAPIMAGQSNNAASKAQAQVAANTETAANAEALQVALGQANGTASAQDIEDGTDGTDAASAMVGARITAAKNPSSDQIASSKQQAFANLKPASDVKTTETQALQPDAGTSKADSKDANAKGGDSNSGDGAPDKSQTASSASPQAPDAQQDFQTASAAAQNASVTSHVADNSASSAAVSSAAVNTTSTHPIGLSGVAVGPDKAPQDPSNSLPPSVNTLAVTIAAKSVEGAKQFDIRLDPPELGRVDVRLSVDSTGKAQAHLTVEKPQTLDMLQRDSGSLQRSLKESGVDLSNNGLQFSLKNQQQQSASVPTPAQGRKLSVTAIPAAVASTSTHGFAHDHARLDIRV
jgi:flagellar hook-length control protein FliK